MLVRGRYDVVVLDYYIFYYFLQKYLKKNTGKQFNANEIERFALIPEVSAYVGFHDKSLRDKFNKQLLLYKSQAKDKAVINKYIKEVF